MSCQAPVKLIGILIAAVFLVGLLFVGSGRAAINPQINYQGKLTDSNDVTVSDATIDMVFRLYTQAGGGTPLATEEWTAAKLWTDTSITFTEGDTTNCGGDDKVAYTNDTNESTLAAGQYLWNITKKESAVIKSVDTTNNFICVYDTFSAWSNGDDATNQIFTVSGLFSVMIGTLTDLSSIDFNQTLWLGVQVGSDSEMVPRKKLGAVPAAFEADKLDGIDSTSFARSDADDTISGLFTITKEPTGTGVGQGSLYINPSNATADYTLFGIAENGVELFRFDADGDLLATGDLTVGGSITSGSITSSGNITMPDLGWIGLGAAKGRLTFDDATTDYLYFSDANIGINTSTPDYTLDVVGTLSVSATSTFSGNVGIGTTNPGSLLELAGTDADKILTITTATTTYDPYIRFRTGTSSTTQALIGIDQSDSNKLKLVRGSDIATSTGITLDSSGNVGIGTTGPDAKLDILSTGNNNLRLTYTDGSVYSNLYVDSAGQLNIDSTGDQVIVQDTLFVEDHDVYIDSNATRLYLGETQQGSIYYDGSDMQLITTAGDIALMPSGNVGIGTTNPGSKLDVAGTAQLRGAAGGTGLYVDTAGKVGIGTTNPGAKLEVLSGSEQLRLSHTQGTYTSFFTDSQGWLSIDASGERVSFNGNQIYGAVLVPLYPYVTNAGPTVIGHFEDDLLFAHMRYTVTVSEPPDIGDVANLFDARSRSEAIWLNDSTTFPVVITIDRGGAQDRFYAFGAQFIYGHNPTSVKIEVSTDGTTWSTVLDKTNNNDGFVFARVNQDQVRYIRYSFGPSNTDRVMVTKLMAWSAIPTAQFVAGPGLYVGGGTMYGDLQVGTSTANKNLYVLGNVGIGDTTPAALLTVGDGDLFQVTSGGLCVTGDTRLRRRRRRRKVKSQKSKVKITSQNSKVFEDDDYIYDEVAIKDIQPGDEIASLDEKTGKLVWRQVRALMDMGVKEIYKLTTSSGKNIRTTANHPYLAREINQKAPTWWSFLVRRPVELNHTPQSGAIWLSISDRIRPVSASPYLRSAYSTIVKKENNTLFESAAFGLPPDGSVTLIDNQLYYSKPNNSVKGRWTKVSKLRIGQEIAVVAGASASWERIVKIERLPAEQVYDIEVEGTHNFIGNDIVAHNTYIYGLPTGTGVGQGSLYINPSNATADYTLFGIAENGVELFRFDADGDLLATGDLTVGGSITSGNITSSGNITMPDLGWIGLGSAKGRLTFDDATTDYLYFSDANIGINTSTPDYTLDVVGTMAVSATSTFDGDIVAAGAIDQADLDTTTGEVSISDSTCTSGTTSSNLTLPGGEYGFYPQLKLTGTNSCIFPSSIEAHINSGNPGTSYATKIYLALGVGTSGTWNVTFYAQQRYVQASPPYFLDGYLIKHFIYLLRDKNTGEVKASYSAEDPPWENNGGDKNAVPHPFYDYYTKDSLPENIEVAMIDPENVEEWKAEAKKKGISLLEYINTFMEVDPTYYEPPISPETGKPITLPRQTTWRHLRLKADAYQIQVQPVIEVIPQSAADLAEYFKSDALLGPGDVVEIAKASEVKNDNKDDYILVKSSKPYSSKLLGVISSNPAQVLNVGGSDGKLPLALAGQVLTKVSTENGPIEPGDPITSSSVPGVGMKATKAGRVVGLALESLSDADFENCNTENSSKIENCELKIGRIMVFVNPHWYGGTLLADGSMENIGEVELPNASQTSGDENPLLAWLQEKIGATKDMPAAFYNFLASIGGTVRDGVLALRELVVDRLIARTLIADKVVAKNSFILRTERPDTCVQVTANSNGQLNTAIVPCEQEGVTNEVTNEESPSFEIPAVVVEEVASSTVDSGEGIEGTGTEGIEGTGTEGTEGTGTEGIEGTGTEGIEDTEVSDEAASSSVDVAAESNAAAASSTPSAPIENSTPPSSTEAQADATADTMLNSTDYSTDYSTDHSTDYNTDEHTNDTGDDTVNDAANDTADGTANDAVE